MRDVLLVSAVGLWGFYFPIQTLSQASFNQCKHSPLILLLILTSFNMSKFSSPNQDEELGGGGWRGVPAVCMEQFPYYLWVQVALVTFQTEYVMKFVACVVFSGESLEQRHH